MPIIIHTKIEANVGNNRGFTRRSRIRFDIFNFVSFYSEILKFVTTVYSLTGSRIDGQNIFELDNIKILLVFRLNFSMLMTAHPRITIKGKPKLMLAYFEKIYRSTLGYLWNYCDITFPYLFRISSYEGLSIGYRYILYIFLWWEMMSTSSFIWLFEGACMIVHVWEWICKIL